MNPPADVVVVCTTVHSEDAARLLAREIVENRLAACVQRVPIHSTYRWNGAMEECEEFLLTAKTRSTLAEPLTRFIRERHTYEVPEILVLPIRDGLQVYLDWILAETKAPS